MEIKCSDKYSLTNDELALLDIVNDFEIKLDDEHIICFKDLLKRVVVRLDGKADRIKKLPFSEDQLKEEISKLKGEIEQLESYIQSKDSNNIEKDWDFYDSLFGDLIKGERIRQDEGGEGALDVSSDEHKKQLLKDWKKRASSLLEKLEKVKETNDYYDHISLKGQFSPSAMEVTLFIDNMDEDNGIRKMEDVVYVYVHEMLHAYYYCCFNEPGNNVREIEECMAEFGALCFLEKLKKEKPAFSDVFEHAKKSVNNKRYTVGGLAAYGFGKYVFDHCANKEAWLLAYSKKSLLLDICMPDVDEYVKRVYPIYPIKEYECFKSLERVLFDNQSRYVFEHYREFHDVSLRILLVDDKVGGNIEKVPPCARPEYKDITTLKELSIEKCPPEDCKNYQCKLCTIKRLMDDSDKADGKNVLFNGIGRVLDYFYWNEKEIECYYCPTTLTDFIEDGSADLDDFDEIVLHEKSDLSCCSLAQLLNSVKQWCNIGEKPLEIQSDFQPLQDLEGSGPTKARKSIDKVQIIGVRDVRTALLLLSRYKFDMLFVDYLLDKKGDGNNEREYSIQFFEFLSTDYDKKAEGEKDTKKKEKYQVLAGLRRAILDNRGPLDKLWIMPITGFNSPFIQTLQNKNVPLISTRWHIENGADPITTPWQFLVKLNQFIELQLKGCVYNMGQLIHFLAYSGANLKRKYPYDRKKFNCLFKPQKPDCHFHDFKHLWVPSSQISLAILALDPLSDAMQ